MGRYMNRLVGDSLGEKNCLKGYLGNVYHNLKMDLLLQSII